MPERQTPREQGMGKGQSASAAASASGSATSSGGRTARAQSLAAGRAASAGGARGEKRKRESGENRAGNRRGLAAGHDGKQTNRCKECAEEEIDEDAQFAAICDFCSTVLEAVGVGDTPRHRHVWFAAGSQSIAPHRSSPMHADKP